jgi:phage-related protein
MASSSKPRGYFRTFYLVSVRGPLQVLHTIQAGDKQTAITTLTEWAAARGMTVMSDANDTGADCRIRIDTPVE